MSIWSSWIYHYGLGSAFFVACLLLLVRQGALRISTSRDRWLAASLVAGLGLFALLHGLWIAYVQG